MKFLLLALSPGLGSADHDPACETAVPTDARITVTINAEARVSVVLAGSLPPPVQCGTQAELLVKILNQGFVTSRLVAEFVSEALPKAILEFTPEPLRGVREETRTLHLTLTIPGPTDIAIAFRSQNNAPKLGGRDRLFLDALPLRRGAVSHVPLSLADRLAGSRTRAAYGSSLQVTTGLGSFESGRFIRVGQAAEKFVSAHLMQPLIRWEPCDQLPHRNDLPYTRPLGE